jgi:hypothetical protein
MFILLVLAAATLRSERFEVKNQRYESRYDRLATTLQTIIKQFANVNVYFLSHPEAIKLRSLYTRNKRSKRIPFRLASQQSTEETASS